MLAFGLAAAVFFGAAAFLAAGAVLALVVVFLGAPTFFSVFGALLVADFCGHSLVASPRDVDSRRGIP